MINTADSLPPRKKESRSSTLQALALSVARRGTVEGSRPYGARPIAQKCSEPNVNVPGRLEDALRLSSTTLTYQSVFSWIDLRSYDIKVAEVSKQSACILQQ